MPQGWWLATTFLEYYTALGYPAYHSGVDLNSGRGYQDAHLPVCAPVDGRVVYAGSPGGAWGTMLIIETEFPVLGKRWIRLAHITNLRKRAGDITRQGEEIAQIAGRGESPWISHLHYDISKTDLSQRPGYAPIKRHDILAREFEDPVRFTLQNLPKSAIWGIHDWEAVTALEAKPPTRPFALCFSISLQRGESIPRLPPTIPERTKALLVPIVRINWGYYPMGTIPTHHDTRHKFMMEAIREINRVMRPGIGFVTIGNEPNNPFEWPQGEKLTPLHVADAYKGIRDWVHWGIRMGLPALDPYNFESGLTPQQWIREMVGRVGKDAIQAIFLHAKTQGSDPAQVESPEKFRVGGLQGNFYHFRAVEDQLREYKELGLGHLPVIIKEANPQRKNDGSLGWEPSRAVEWLRAAQVYCDKLASIWQGPVYVVFYRFATYDPWAMPKQARDALL